VPLPVETFVPGPRDALDEAYCRYEALGTRLRDPAAR